MSCLDCVINRTKKRRMLTVWGREGKPASRRRYSWRLHVSLQNSPFYSFFFLINYFFLSQEEASRGICDDRPSAPAVLSEKKMDSSNHNKVKVMATQLLAKFEENAPASQTGLKRQVGEPSISSCLVNIPTSGVTWQRGLQVDSGQAPYLFQQRVGGVSVMTGLGGGIEIAELQFVWEGAVGLLDTRQCCRRRERDIYCCSVEKKIKVRLPFVLFLTCVLIIRTVWPNSSSKQVCLWFACGIDVHQVLLLHCPGQIVVL